MNQVLRTRDIWEAALAVSLGFNEYEIVVENGAKGLPPKATFVIPCEAAERIATEYRTGRAMANVQALKVYVNLLRGRMWDAIRERAGTEPVF